MLQQGSNRVIPGDRAIIGKGDGRYSTEPKKLSGENFDDLPIVDRERTRSISTCSNDSLGNYDESEVATIFATSCTPEEYAAAKGTRGVLEDPQVVYFSFEKGVKRHYYVGWDDPLYFVGWEVFIEHLGVGHIVSCLGPYFSGVRFQVQVSSDIVDE
jgi:hypothetical protein